jgi:predicted  nucleic acid-binding Zn-ribbon protein
VGELKLELEALDNKKAELKAKIEQAKKSVSEFTSSIDGMRHKRDHTLTEIDRLQKEAIVS